MKKLCFPVFLCLFCSYIPAQEITVSFISKIIGTTIDSFLVMNQRTGQTVKLEENFSLVLTKATGISRLTELNKQFSVYPNPANGEVTLSFVCTTNEKVNVQVFNVAGQLLAINKLDLPSGRHAFRVNFPGEGIYLVSVKKSDEILTFKTVQMKSRWNECKIVYNGSENTGLLKHAVPKKSMIYEPGDILYSTAHSGNNITVVTGSPTADEIYLVDFYTCSDADGRNYRIVVIDDLVWMAENLAYLPAVSPSSTGSLTDPLYYVNGYNGTSMVEAKATAVYKISGVLYNWVAAKSACPAGWRLPSDTDWKKLEMALGMTQEQVDEFGERGTEQGTGLKTTSGWNNDGNGTNATGFSGLPGGSRAINGYFHYLGQRGFWWSSTDFMTAFAGYRQLSCDTATINRTTTSKEYGFSVRCVKY